MSRRHRADEAALSLTPSILLPKTDTVPSWLPPMPSTAKGRGDAADNLPGAPRRNGVVGSGARVASATTHHCLLRLRALQKLGRESGTEENRPSVPVASES